MDKLFIKHLSKEIITLMEYRDEEIKSRDEEINRLEKRIQMFLNEEADTCECGNDIDCHDDQHMHVYQCNQCRKKICHECADDWILTSCFYENGQFRDTVVSHDDYEYDHYEYCSTNCFTLRFGKMPVIGQIYERPRS